MLHDEQVSYNMPWYEYINIRYGSHFTLILIFFRNFHQMINYDDFIKVKEQTGEKCKKFFTATIFSKLYQNDPFGR